jgi:hypothetical protein
VRTIGYNEFEPLNGLVIRSSQPMKAQKIPKSQKTPFSKFRLDTAYKVLNLRRLTPWKNQRFEDVQPSNIFQNYLKRLHQSFDLERSEESKKLIIDLILVEATTDFPNLKVWKGGALESAIARGTADYLITENMGYISTPMLCVVEAKKDDFEQGLAQCLVEMQACQWNNSNDGRSIDVFGIVTNGEGWKFYKFTTENQVYETSLYSLENIPKILGILNLIFQDCDRHLSHN